MAELATASVDEAVAATYKYFDEFEKNPDLKYNERFVPIFISRPGVGKSASIAAESAKRNRKLITLNLACIEPVDILGLGAREKVGRRWVTKTALPAWAMTALEGNCDILVDEFNNCQPETLAGFQIMFSAFEIDGHPLPKTTHIIGACNPPGDDALVAANQLSGAFRRRLSFVPITDNFEWVQKTHNIKIPISFKKQEMLPITEYINYQGINSANVDDMMRVINTKSLTEKEKYLLIEGLGSNVRKLAVKLGLLNDELIDFEVLRTDDGFTYNEWVKDPTDEPEIMTQNGWANRKITNTNTYSRAKGFTSRIKNVQVYNTTLELLNKKFAADVALDETPLARLDMEY